MARHLHRRPSDLLNSAHVVHHAFTSVPVPVGTPSLLRSTREPFNAAN
jgi:hypothetical protein